MKKLFTILAVALCSTLAMAQTNQYFWANGRFIMGNPIDQIDSITFGQLENTDSITLYLPHTIKVVHDTIIKYVTIHDTICPDQPKWKDGVLPGEFSISATKKVKFSQGNLWYNPSLDSHLCADGSTQQGTWKFSENQYDTISFPANKSVINSTYNNWFDAFAWGTSGWSGGVANYQPWSITTNYSNHYVGGSRYNDLSGSYAYADWGVYNAISNGGDTPELWRTLSMDEWNYIIEERENADNLKTLAKVNGICGGILLPDAFVNTTGVTFNINNSDTTKQVLNDLSVEQWEKLESAGSVFLPQGLGFSFTWGNNIWNMGNDLYWSSTHGDYAGAMGIQSFAEETGIGIKEYGRVRCDSEHVRLVQDIK